MLSRGYPSFLAVFCITAVKKLIGLNKYDMHNDLGAIISFADHSPNYFTLSNRSANQLANNFLLK